jgi:hypothetical protein
VLRSPNRFTEDTLVRARIAVVSAALCLALAAAAEEPAAKPAEPAAPHAAGAEEFTGFKDLQVLPKDIKKDELKATMKAFSAALGVKCTHCHVDKAFAKDTEKKTAAREMMKMTWSINTTFLKGKDQITCNTCHRGHDEPTERIKHQ